MAYTVGYSRENAPRVGAFFNSTGVFNPQAKKDTENNFSNLFAQFKKEGIIAPDSILATKRIFSPHEVAVIADEFTRKLVNVIIIVNSAFVNGNAFATLAIHPYLLKIPVIVTADREAVFADSREWTTNSWCGVIMNNYVAKQLGRYMYPLAGSPLDPAYQDELKMLLNCFRAVAHMRKDFMGRFGDSPSGFHSAQGDELTYSRVFGTRMDRVDLMAVMNTYRERQVKGLLKTASFSEDDVKATSARMKSGKVCLVDDTMLAAGARLYHAFKAHIEANGYTSATFKCWPELQSEYFPYTPCAAIGQLLADRIVAGAGCEGDIPTTVAQTLGTLLAGRPAALLDFINHIGSSEILQLAHCGVGIPGQMEKNEALGFSSPRRQCGIYVGPDHIGQYQYGPKTGIGLIPCKDSFKMLVFTGANSAETDKSILYCAADIRMKNYKKLNRVILDHGFSHHLAVAMADISRELKVLCDYYGIEYIGVN